jgi:hypothetical protein
VSVTDSCRSGGGAGTRNARLLAEWEAEWVEDEKRREEDRRRDPEGAAQLEKLAAAINGGELDDHERKKRSLARFAERSSLWCSLCHTDFNDGDVVYRERAIGEPYPWGGMRWSLKSICDACVGKRHPSWREARSKPKPCAGGCGMLVSHWYRERWSGVRDKFVDAITTCSLRCSEKAQAERRRVDHDVRNCAVCEELFVPKRADARYCSNACRQDAYRKRKLGAIP